MATTALESKTINLFGEEVEIFPQYCTNEHGCLNCTLQGKILCDPKYRLAEEKGTAPQKNSEAVALGRRGGLKGGKARAEKLTPARRTEIAKKAVKARWDKTKAAKIVAPTKEQFEGDLKMACQPLVKPTDEISELDIPQRAINALLAIKVTTIKQLASLSEDELYKIKGIGGGTVHRIKLILRRVKREAQNDIKTDGNDAFENQLRSLIAKVQSELVDLDNEMDTLSNRRTTLTIEVEAYETALHSYLERNGGKRNGNTSSQN